MVASGQYQMNSREYELRAAQVQRSEIDRQISEFEAERARLDKLISDLQPKIGDQTLRRQLRPALRVC
jgi:hypothetical protein